ncbi:MAG: hypothetical protein R3D62_11090 [Xanthobacteraceae bacterium]
MQQMVEVLSALAVLGLPGPFILAVAMPKTFAPRGDRFMGAAVYGAAWIAAQTCLQLTSLSA